MSGVHERRGRTDSGSLPLSIATEARRWTTKGGCFGAASVRPTAGASPTVGGASATSQARPRAVWLALWLSDT